MTQITVNAFGTGVGLRDSEQATAFARHVALFLSKRTDHVAVDGAVYVVRDDETGSMTFATFNGRRWTHEQAITVADLAREAIPFAALAMRPDKDVMNHLHDFTRDDQTHNPRKDT